MSHTPPHLAYLSLGSNIDPESHLPAAVRLLSAFGRVVGVSRVWQSPAVGDVNQADFCNAAMCLEGAWTASALVSPSGPLHRVEQQLGRVRDPANKNAARTIDIDLSLFDREVLQVESRRIPDPELFERAFVAVPLSELSGAELPRTYGRSLADVAARLREQQPLTLRADIVLPLC